MILHQRRVLGLYALCLRSELWRENRWRLWQAKDSRSQATQELSPEAEHARWQGSRPAAPSVIFHTDIFLYPPHSPIPARYTISMAAGLEALGAAAAIAQFIEYGIGMITKIVEVHRSSNGTTDDLQHMNTMVSRFRDMNSRMLSEHCQQVAALSTAESDFSSVARQCGDVASELLQILDKLQVKGAKSIRKSVWIAWRADRTNPTIRSLQRRLQSLRQELNEQLLRVIRLDGYLQYGHVCD